MKPSFKPAFAFICLSLALNLNLQAQKKETSSNPISSKPTTTVLQSSESNKGKSSKTNPVVINPDSNPKLKVRFSDLFPSAEQQQWTLLEKTYHVSFVNHGRKTRASFTQNGKLNYVISDCTMEQLPTKLSQKIMKEYPGYELMQGSEITANDQVTYQLILESDKEYVTLKSNGDVIEKMQQTIKSNQKK